MIAENLFSIILIVVTITVGLFFMKRNKRKGNLNLPPGPRGLPILGSLHKLDPTNPTNSLIQMAEEYGSNGLFSIKMGSVYTVIITDYNLIKEALNKDTFTGRAPLFLTHGLMDGYGIIASDGERWKDQRKLLFSWMRSLGAARGSLARPVLFAKLSKAVDGLENKILPFLENNDEIDIRDILSKNLGNAIQILTYGVSYEENDPIWKWLVFIQEEGVKAMGVAGILNFLPYLRFVSPSLRHTYITIKKGIMQTYEITKQCVNIRKYHLNETKKTSFEIDKDFLNKEVEFKYLKIFEKSVERIYSFKPSSLIVHKDDCLLDYFLEEQEKRKLDGDIEKLNILSERQLCTFTSDIFGAGLDTSNNTTAWFLFMMALYPDEQEAVRKEIRSVCGNSKPDLEHMADLIYTKAAICETQRIRPVVPLGLPHGTTEDTTLAGYFIPKHAMVMPFLWYILHDPKLWEAPDDFRPSRFIGSDGTLIQPPSFLPFQIGKRMCPGDDLARMIIQIYGSRIISKYRLEFAKKPENIDGIFGLTLAPPEYHLKMTKLIDWA